MRPAPIASRRLRSDRITARTLARVSPDAATQPLTEALTAVGRPLADVVQWQNISFPS